MIRSSVRGNDHSRLLRMLPSARVPTSLVIDIWRTLAMTDPLLDLLWPSGSPSLSCPQGRRRQYRSRRCGRRSPRPLQPGSPFCRAPDNSGLVCKFPHRPPAFICRSSGHSGHLLSSPTSCSNNRHEIFILIARLVKNQFRQAHGARLRPWPVSVIVTAVASQPLMIPDST